MSVSTHVPKPHTPFQWAEQISVAETKRKQALLARGLKKYRIGFRYHSAESSFLEGVFARGDRQLGRVILRAYQLGCRLNGWVEKLQADYWAQAFAECNIDPAQYLRERQDSETLPWDHISCDIPKSYFLKEWKKARTALTTQDCLTASCSSCKACDYESTRNVLFDRERTEKRLKIINPPWQPIIEKRRQGQTSNLLTTADELTPKPVKLEASSGTAGAYSLKEYLKTECETRSGSGRLPSKPAVQRMRLRYSKTGPARFLGHLGLASVFFRAARRAQLPVAFSQGFNPKPRLQFGPPLQLGLESLSEFVDVYFTAIADCSQVMTALNVNLPEGLRIESITEVNLRATALQAEIDRQHFVVESNSQQLQNSAQFSSWQSISLDRTRNRRSQQVVLGDFVEKVDYNGRHIEFTLNQNGSSGTLKPTEVAVALTGIPLNQLKITKTAASTLAD